VLAAGFGVRMHPLTLATPKPLVMLAGKTLLDHVLDRLVAAGVKRAVVNVHYLADMIKAHLDNRIEPEILISDERDLILDTGGGVRKAMRLLGNSGPFFVHNSDSVWLEDKDNAGVLSNMADIFDPERMDCLLMLSGRESTLGYAGDGDFDMCPDAQIRRKQSGQTAKYVFAGVSIVNPRLFSEEPGRNAFSLNNIFDKAIACRRAFGVVHNSLWMHIGTAKALNDAERALENSRPTTKY
jgi:MurNAc alpha-1-phosphate uridylyltransferase